MKKKQVLSLEWAESETWCSEPGPISGTTKNYPDGTILSVEVKGTPENTSLLTIDNCKVSSNGFDFNWKVMDILPAGGPSWQDRRSLLGGVGQVATPDPMAVRFIPNVKRTQADHSVQYKKQDGSGSWVNVSVDCLFELEVRNYNLIIHGGLNYVRGWGKEVLKLADASLGGGFPLYGGESYHFGYQDAGSGKFKYWNGSAFVDTPAAWTPTNSNHFGAAFYKKGNSWVFLDDSSQSWPQKLPDWPQDKYKGPANKTDSTLATWKRQIDSMWTDKFDIKRVECASTLDECCRYKTVCQSVFQEVDSFGDHVIIITYENVRSHALLWSMADTRPGLAPHEFGHHLGAPDEYAGVDSTQIGLNDSDGLVDGVDSGSIMGSGMTTVKKRHYKGIVEVLAQLISDQFGKDYTYAPTGKAANLASPLDAAVAPPGTSASSANAVLIGAIIGGIIGAVAGAIIGFIASGGDPGAAAAGALVGAAAGAIIGAGIGSLF